MAQGWGSKKFRLNKFLFFSTFLYASCTLFLWPWVFFFYLVILCHSVFKVGLISSSLHALILWTLWSPVGEDLSTPVSHLSLPSEISTWIINAAFRTCLPAQGNASLSSSAFFVASDSRRSWVSDWLHLRLIHILYIAGLDPHRIGNFWLFFVLAVLLSAGEMKSLGKKVEGHNFFFRIFFIKKLSVCVCHLDADGNI